MILEGIVTTLSAQGTPNISTMGPDVDDQLDRFSLKPYRSSLTYQNLKRNGQGVLHVTDDVELLARAAVKRLDPLPPLQPATEIDGVVLSDACRWYAFRVTELDDSRERTRIECEVVDRGRLRDFFGFNRAKHAVVEAAILATRTQFLPVAEIRIEFDRLGMIVEKTAGDQERRAFNFLREFIDTECSGADRTSESNDA
ncbi:MAG: DUF447 family protein [Pirellulaceae bacterium]|jgi:hypothetical protein|nr:DUF447 family protein [Pirellulaceae bacterium]HJN11427.1 DUF447 family protein [Pirellulaceae bacterium]